MTDNSTEEEVKRCEKLVAEEEKGVKEQREPVVRGGWNKLGLGFAVGETFKGFLFKFQQGSHITLMSWIYQRNNHVPCLNPTIVHDRVEFYFMY